MKNSVYMSSQVEMVRLESDESDNYTPHPNISLLTPDHVESHTSSSDRYYDRSVHLYVCYRG